MERTAKIAPDGALKALEKAITLNSKVKKQAADDADLKALADQHPGGT